MMQSTGVLRVSAPGNPQRHSVSTRRSRNLATVEQNIKETQNKRPGGRNTGVQENEANCEVDTEIISSIVILLPCVALTAIATLVNRASIRTLSIVKLPEALPEGEVRHQEKTNVPEGILLDVVHKVTVGTRMEEMATQSQLSSIALLAT